MTFDECELCHCWAYLEEHHVFGAANRKHSERLGMVAWLCPSCHRTGKKAVHHDYAVSLALKRKHQAKFEETHSREEFMAIMGRNYLL